MLLLYFSGKQHSKMRGACMQGGGSVPKTWSVRVHLCVNRETKEFVEENLSQLSKGDSPHWKTCKPHGRGTQGGDGKETVREHPACRSLGERGHHATGKKIRGDIFCSNYKQRGREGNSVSEIKCFPDGTHKVMQFIYCKFLRAVFTH